ncbi:hypothetical protein J2754_003019 [Halarchaeum solikamskense]|uniref:DUF7437 domain-containing protein n=1 Tax=Halarchaeum nitratireducens TaxID=489913 RepID=UPI001FD99AB7|nr:hypothetical protein [Halarchaeum solikamskense]MBP2252673.1 hypothetical protein [Halarchaeum solikamskense]
MAGAPIGKRGCEESGVSMFFAVQRLLTDADLAYFYTDLLLNSPTTVKRAMDRQGIVKSTAYKYANELAELGVAEELDEYEDGAALWTAEPVVGTWETEAAELVVSPVVIAVYGASTVDDDLEYFLERYGEATLLHAIVETDAYLQGEQTRRGLATALDVPSAAGIAVSQAIEAIIGRVSPVDPAFPDYSGDVHVRAIDDAPYTVDA